MELPRSKLIKLELDLFPKYTFYNTCNHLILSLRNLKYSFIQEACELFQFLDRRAVAPYESKALTHVIYNVI